VKLKKTLKPPRPGKKTQKTQKIQKTQKNPLGWFFLKKPGFFPTLQAEAILKIKKIQK
jgi:hypothetical protein